MSGVQGCAGLRQNAAAGVLHTGNATVVAESEYSIFSMQAPDTVQTRKQPSEFF